KDALERGAEKIILGIGGSATNDLGIGMATALGYRFLDSEGKEVQPTGENLIRIQRIEKDRINPLLKNVDLQIASDVTNPLYGKNGAARIYASQKGASKEEVEWLDRGLKHLSGIIQKQLGVDLQNIPGAGAAGGLGGGAIAFFNGKIESGIKIIKNIAGFDQKIKDANWIITGEGKIDAQTFSGKVISGVLESAKKQKTAVAVFCGISELTTLEIREKGIDYLCEISKNEISLDTAYKNTFKNLVDAAKDFAKDIC
ncbi:MAG: glycerate kinase, partial [Flavobacteriia bacterium]